MGYPLLPNEAVRSLEMARKQRSPLGQRMKWGAEQVGLTSEVIAERLGVGASTVRGWWTGHSEPAVEMLRQYAALTLVSVDYLVSGSDQTMGSSGSLAEWRLRFSELVRQGLEPMEAIDRITGEKPAGVEDWDLTTEEREVLTGAGPAMRQTLQKVAPNWESLSEQDREIVLALIERLAKPPPGDGEPG